MNSVNSVNNVNSVNSVNNVNNVNNDNVITYFDKVKFALTSPDYVLNTWFISTHRQPIKHRLLPVFGL